MSLFFELLEKVEPPEIRDALRKWHTESVTVYFSEMHAAYIASEMPTISNRDGENLCNAIWRELKHKVTFEFPRINGAIFNPQVVVRASIAILKEQV